MAFSHRHFFCHADLDSREQQWIPPVKFDAMPDRLRSGIRTAGEDCLLGF